MKLSEQWIINKAQKYEVVSFDVYDTLLHRRYENPSEVFRDVEKKLRRLPDSDREEKFYGKRCRAERLARANTQAEEITLKDIYQYYETQQDKQFLMEMEIEAELACAYPDKRMQDVFRLLLERGKRIVIISDMYLPHEVIEKILGKVGYVGYEKAYVSSEILLTKKTGNLFRYVSNELNGRKFLHIGDRFTTDYCNAKKNGLGGIWYAGPYLKRISGGFSAAR